MSAARCAASALCGILLAFVCTCASGRIVDEQAAQASAQTSTVFLAAYGEYAHNTSVPSRSETAHPGVDPWYTHLAPSVLGNSSIWLYFNDYLLWTVLAAPDNSTRQGAVAAGLRAGLFVIAGCAPSHLARWS